MRMAAVGASPLAAKDRLEAQWSEDMALQRWAASLLTRPACLLSMGTQGLEDKDELLSRYTFQVVCYLKKMQYLLYKVAWKWKCGQIKC